MRNYNANDVLAFAESLRDKDGFVPVYDIRGTHTRWTYTDRPDPADPEHSITSSSPDPDSFTHELQVKKLVTYSGKNAAGEYTRVGFEVGGGWYKKPNDTGKLEEVYVPGFKRVLFIDERTPIGQPDGPVTQTLSVDEDWIN